MTERDALLAAILSSPKDDTPRMIYADWLEDRGEVERAEFIRVQCELARTARSCPQGIANAEVGYRHNPHRCFMCSDNDGVIYDCDNPKELRRRERELLIGSPNGAWGANGWFSDLLSGFGHRWEQDDLKWTFARGFISSITLSWSDFLRHHAALIWSPRQTTECDNCGGAGEFTRENSDPPYGPCPGCGGCMWTGPYYCKDDHGWDKGTGRIPRPFAPTAQPIETVRLNAVPFSRDQLSWESFVAIEGIGRSGQFNRVKCGTCGGTGEWEGGDPSYLTDCSSCRGRPLNLWRCDAWPGVDFVMPITS